MPKYIRSDKLQDNVFIPVKLSDQILEGTLAHTIQYVIDQKIDMSMFEEKFANDTTGRPAHNPRILLKLILFSYSNGINSSRRIHNFASQNLVAMALAENTVPDFTVIAAFISGMAAEVTAVFNNVLLVASEMDLLGNTVFALDGCKLPSNASKEKSGTFGDLRKKQEKLKEKISNLVETHKQLDSQKQSEVSIRKKNAIDKMEKRIDRIEAFLSTHEARIGKRNKEAQSNITDNESSKMKTSHGVIQGYNGQAMVDDKHQVIVASKAFGKGQDHTLLKPMLDSAMENFKQLGKSDNFLQGKRVIADTGYFSEENLDAADERSIDAFIPDQNFRKRDIRFVSKKRHVPGRLDKICRDDFVYDEKKDVVICPMGQELHLSKGAIRQVKNFI